MSRSILHDERVISKLAESKPVKFAAQLTASAIHKGSDRRSPSLTPQLDHPIPHPLPFQCTP